MVEQVIVLMFELAVIGTASLTIIGVGELRHKRALELRGRDVSGFTYTHQKVWWVVSKLSVALWRAVKGTFSLGKFARRKAVWQDLEINEEVLFIDSNGGVTRQLPFK